MKWSGKKLLPLLLLALLACLPVTSLAESTYQVTESQLNELQTIYTTLKAQSKEQQTLLTEQEMQIKTLETQLTTSSEEISSSKTQLAQAREQLAALEQSWRKSEAGQKKTERRLKRQRTLWMIVAGATLGWGISRT